MSVLVEKQMGDLIICVVNSHCWSLTGASKNNLAEDVSGSGSTRHSEFDEFLSLDETVYYVLEEDDIRILSPL